MYSVATPSIRSYPSQDEDAVAAEFDALFGLETEHAADQLPSVPVKITEEPLEAHELPSVPVNVVDLPDVPINTVDDILAEVARDEGLSGCQSRLSNYHDAVLTSVTSP